MRKTITIGEKALDFEATLGTSELYQIFTGDNLFETLASFRGTKTTDGAAYKLLDVYKKMMFVMNVQATENSPKEMRAKMNIDSYLDWLFQFSNDDITRDITNQIAELWSASKKTHSQAKNP